MSRLAKIFCLYVLPVVLSHAHASTWLEAQLIDRWGRSTLFNVHHAGHRYYLGEPGREYGIRLHNRSPHRVLAVVSVDGVNVLTGQTASAQQRGYVLAPYATVRIDGWRKNLSEVASFHFAHLRNSYAARTGRPDHVGVIGVAVFREKPSRPCCMPSGPWIQEKKETQGSEDQGYSAGVPSARAQAERPSADANHGFGLAAPMPERLGTGHGRRRHSSAIEVRFERASSVPDQQLRLYYDTRQNLIARGILPGPPPVAPAPPLPFPQDGFVPDP